MKYNDFSISTDNDFSIIKQSFVKSEEQENNDLQIILNKMYEQKSTLEKQNNSSFSDVIHKINDSITELESIIKNNNYNKPHVHKLDTENGAISPFRGNYEMRGETQPMTPNNNSYSTPKQITSDNNTLLSPASPTNPNERTPARQNPINTLKRNRPLQGNFLSNIIKSFNINKAFNKTAHIDYTQKPHRNKFHNTSHYIIEDAKTNSIFPRNLTITDDIKHCSHEERFKTRQIDIIRLLLLYLAMRPHYKYCSRIANLTYNQFDILLDLDNK